MKQLYLILIISIFTINSNAQPITAHPYKYMEIPEPVTNTAVIGWTHPTTFEHFVYYFGGMDSTKIYSGIHLRSFKVSIDSMTATQIASLPDTLGKIAMSASVINNKAYIIGGYHVLSDSTEITSNKVHVYDLLGDTFMADAAPVPIPIDDHVQFTYKDSLIYCITGWSNTDNITNVQIFDPANNKWMQGTPVPGIGHYRVFGASGGVYDTTIMYLGGAAPGGPGFETKNYLRFGKIDKNDPTQIEWLSDTTQYKINLYRSACVDIKPGLIWFGGSYTAYNYNGIGYDNITKAKPNQKWFYSYGGNEFTTHHHLVPSNVPMDLRGGGYLGGNFYYVGGLSDQLTVLRHITSISFRGSVNKIEAINVNLYPNPASTFITIENEDLKQLKLEIYNPQGQLVKSVDTAENNFIINTEDLTSGTYFVRILNHQNIYYKKIVIQH